MQFQNAARDARGTRWFNDLAPDIRHARRSLRRRPLFTLVAVLTLALGIAASTTLFSVVKAVLVAPLPYRDSNSLVMIWSAWKGFDRTWLSYDEYEAYETEIPAIANAAIFSDGVVNLTEGDQPERVRVGLVQQDVFDILGASPLLGRVFTAEEDRPNGSNVIMLSHALWQRRYQSDTSVVGRTMQVNGQAATIIGVMPEGFRLPLDFGGDGPTLAWRPLATDAERNGAMPGPAFSPGGGSHGFYGVARLAPGATSAQADQQLQAFFAARVADGSVPAEMQFRAFTVPVAAQVTGRIRTTLLVVFGAVGFVLLIACANVAGLLLVRGEARRRELAVRVALGATPARLSRQLLTESVVLACAGGALGIVLSAIGVAVVRATAPGDLPRFDEARLDATVLLFALASTACAAVIAGVLPALQASHVSPTGDLKDGGRGATTGVSRLRWRQALVSTEIALALVLVCGAGLMVRTVSSLLSVDAGIRPAGVLTMRLSTPAAFYPDSVAVERFHRELTRQVQALPGVTAVGTVRNLPLSGPMGDWGLGIEGYVPPHGSAPADWQVVGPGYFEAMGLALRRGRVLDARDGMDAPLAMVVNERFVELYLPDRDPIGRRVMVGGSAPEKAYRIVGVVGNVRHNGLTTEVKAQFYATVGQFATAPGNTTRSFSLVVRTGADPLALAPAIRGVVRGMDARLPISDVHTMDDVLNASIAEPRFAMGLLTLFGMLALGLAAIGVFGIVAQIVAARSHEFGIRAALGAAPRQLVLLGVRGAIAQTVVGLVAGVAGALVLTRALRGMLEGVTPTDLPTFATVVAITGVVALLATIGPARRAAKADPMVVLHEG
ncbi:MAG TPA: ABC transporter permease [Gemmatimonas sp.]|nr:ABC transporter permease [Gemmatimonas sp.]